MEESISIAKTPTMSETAVLLSRIKAGDDAAKNELAAHCYPLLLKWAHGRIPYTDVSLLETRDLVQETFIRGMKKVDQIHVKKPGAFLAYLRTIFINCVRDVARRSKGKENINGYHNSQTRFTDAINLDEFIAYEKALNQLPESDQEAVILRIEFGLSYHEIAEATDKPSADAARMQVKRALVKLADHML